MSSGKPGAGFPNVVVTMLVLSGHSHHQVRKCIQMWHKEVKKHEIQWLCIFNLKWSDSRMRSVKENVTGNRRDHNHWPVALCMNFWVREESRKKWAHSEKWIFNLFWIAINILLQASKLKAEVHAWRLWNWSREVADLAPSQTLRPVPQPVCEYNPFLKL